jgi:hypothetical protein
MVPAYCSRGDVGVQCRYVSYCHGGMEGVNRGMDTEEVGHVANWALLFWCTTAQAINLARREEHMGKEMSTEGLVFDWTQAVLRPKVTNRKHARTSRLRGPQPPNQPETLSSPDFPFRPYHHSHDSSAQRPCIHILSCNVIICPFTSVIILYYRIKASTPALDTQEYHHLMLSLNSIVVRVPVLVVLIMSRSPQMRSRSDFLGRFIKGVVKHRSIACRTFHSRVTILAAVSRGRIYSRFPGVGTIWDGQVTVEASHGIHGVVFLMVPALACAISGNDGKEVELNRIESGGARRRRKGNVLGI